MKNNKHDNSLIEEFDEKLSEFEHKIEEDAYSVSNDGFEEEFYQLKESAQDLYSDCLDEGEEDIVRDFMKRLNVIRDEQGMYNEDDELDRMFPDRTDKYDSDGELNSGFSTDKYFGLD